MQMVCIAGKDINFSFNGAIGHSAIVASCVEGSTCSRVAGTSRSIVVMVSAVA